jgi:hypothetical protein
MNKPTFTKGPCKSDWVGEKPHGAAVVWIPDSSTCNERVEVHTSNARANARLIAAAPEMHALLARVASDDLLQRKVRMELAMDARELLAKVEGEK